MEILSTETKKYDISLLGLEFEELNLSPTNWCYYKDILSTFIKNMDEATKVYNLENNVKE